MVIVHWHPHISKYDTMHIPAPLTRSISQGTFDGNMFSWFDRLGLSRCRQLESPTIPTTADLRDHKVHFKFHFPICLRDLTSIAIKIFPILKISWPKKNCTKNGEMPVKGWCFEICAFNTSEKVPSPFFEMSLRTGRNSLTMTLMMMGETQGIEKQQKKNSKSSESRSKSCRSNSISLGYYELKPQHKAILKGGN